MIYADVILYSLLERLGSEVTCTPHQLTLETHWNNDQEVVTSFSVAADASWAQQTAPDNTIYKEFFATSG